ncbi:zinc metalloprotease HtpX [Streptomyces clavuligerus]|uniref:Protease HtpX homolog n=1 Tax=Streptomyces clavuligerus TaxID=1901 RepID=B5H0T5_STRCL|nr:zinc metalloprotease HtpX [Streptomyces clavuligerus]ANW21627.1 zinc metalloprotease HtpX [Streptomyces clavuligerus]AXU16253.1 zinc metalloprotease HtpX [Streptomyces clavuligerus]EDY52181.1 peptidase M48 Ste24p [Streptomyces clavuligerus]EFG05199.1 Putative Zn-dependent protease with chaperone function [Streptomyces clavuligerus]MBY6306411.1 zinc metalloprotease HtpX [Streptomyces clavuligerus]
MAAARTRSRYVPDRGLTTRMVTTMFFIGLLYVVFVGVLLALLRGAWPLILLIAAGLFIAQFWFSDKIAARGMGAREVTPEQAPELHGAVDRICALADMPKPQVAVADSDVPNAFATGRSQKTALVCATTGLLRRLEPEELEGVLAHELSHVAHRDVAVMTIASFLGVLAGVITRVSLYSGLGRAGRSNNNAALVMALVPLVSAVVYVVSFLLTRLLSRYRELAADRAAALLTGRPSALASALTKVTGEMARIPTRDLRRAEPYNAFWFAPAFSSRESLARLLSSHPTLEQRLEQLARISAGLARP